MAAEIKIKKDCTSKMKMFSRRWLELDIMKDWLVPHSDPMKAKCRACNKVINAGKSELVKHASGQKHSQKLLKLKAGKSQTQEALDFITNSLKIESEPCIETAEENGSNKTAKATEVQSSTSSKGIENSEEYDGAYQKKHMELLSRIASSLDRIAWSHEALVKLISPKEHSEMTSD